MPLNEAGKQLVVAPESIAALTMVPLLVIGMIGHLNCICLLFTLMESAKWTSFVVGCLRVTLFQRIDNGAVGNVLTVILSCLEGSSWCADSITDLH